MQPSPQVDLVEILSIMAVLAGIALVLALLLLGWVVWRVRRINLPPGADTLTALRATPLVVVILLDLLDFGLDFLSAPFAWVLLGYLGLKPLRGVTIAESIIPFTQVLPTMTLAWVYARFFDPGRLRTQRGRTDDF